jgi:hypothetical protein
LPLAAPSAFYVYTHARPDGRVFYVGKGTARRAWDFSPTRRTEHHINIVQKHGAKNIIVNIIPQPDEASAFAHEIALIASLKASGVKLINLTDGGEGASGRPFSAKQAAGFALGRRSWSERNLSPETIASIWASSQSEKAKAKRKAWRASEAGQAHFRSLVQATVAELEARAPHEVICAACKTPFMTKHPRAACCSPACQQRARRRKQNTDWHNRELKPYANNTTGVRGVYQTKNGRWLAMIGVDKKLICLGTYEDKADAIQARLEGEKQYGKPSAGRRHRNAP